MTGHAVHLFHGFSVQYSSGPGGIDVTLPERYDNGRHAVADQVRHRAADADKPLVVDLFATTRQPTDHEEIIGRTKDEAAAHTFPFSPALQAP
jgi:hypothetical protein